MKPLSEEAPCLLVIQLQIKAVWLEPNILVAIVLHYYFIAQYSEI